MIAERCRYQDFNVLLVEAIDESIRDLFSPQVLETMYTVLLERYDVTRDELPYRLETAYDILKNVFGIRGGRAISRIIASRLHQKLGLRFEEVPNLDLMDYIEIAKKKLAQVPFSNLPTNPLHRLCTQQELGSPHKEPPALPSPDS